ncbi:MAG TPA: hypothetical protein PLY88_02630 [Candidatus Omnitrophota bacterium]|nr:hypothetical protein [Candidatus Omnitrophota bacterium]HRK61429.1 hypothetical protein [Candidatus Omnitrophota bacterium]
MEENFKKARKITFGMMISLVTMGLAVLLISGARGYGGSSEAKMNFFRLILFVFAFAQIAMAGAIYAGAKRLKTNVNAGKKLVAQIIACALCESVGVFGFALAIMTKTFTDYAMFALIAFAALLFYFPKEKDWKD